MSGGVSWRQQQKNYLLTFHFIMFSKKLKQTKTVASGVELSSSMCDVVTSLKEIWLCQSERATAIDGAAHGIFSPTGRALGLFLFWV